MSEAGVDAHERTRSPASTVADSSALARQNHFAGGAETLQKQAGGSLHLWTIYGSGGHDRRLWSPRLHIAHINRSTAAVTPISMRRDSFRRLLPPDAS